MVRNTCVRILRVSVKERNLRKRKVRKTIKTRKRHMRQFAQLISTVGYLTSRTWGTERKKLYALIRNNTLESCMAPAKYMALTATVTAPASKKEAPEYRYSTEQVVFPGWKVVRGYEKENSEFAYLQIIKDGSVLPYKKIVSKVSMKDLKSHYTEAKLVQLLEQNGIGRPSTFSSLIDKIQERKYVKKTSVKGKSIKCVDFELEGVELSEVETKREFGNEKNKLVIQPLGELVIQFLLRHFDKLFQYGYTKSMEDTLDLIANGDKVWHELCRECLGEITTLSAGLVQTKRETIRIDDDHTYMIGKFGPVIKHTQGEKTTFKSVKTDIDLDRLRRGEYELGDIIVPKGKPGRSLGKHEKKAVILKNGRYGPYVEWNGNKKSVGSISKVVDDISLEDVIPLLQGDGHPSMVRTINNSTSIRHGQYGDYVFHKKPDWKKPQFLKLNDFIVKHGVDSYKTCELSLFTDWLKETHGV